MKWYLKVGIGISIAIIAYLIGNWIPIKYLNPTIDFTSIKSAEYYGLIISSISAFVTFLAVVIALFKDDIRKKWIFSKIELSIPEENFFEVLNSDTEGQVQNLWGL